jgi:hypothetical protein
MQPQDRNIHDKVLFLVCSPFYLMCLWMTLFSLPTLPTSSSSSFLFPLYCNC